MQVPHVMPSLLQLLLEGNMLHGRWRRLDLRPRQVLPRHSFCLVLTRVVAVLASDDKREKTFRCELLNFFHFFWLF
jgi:hypothetical protein